MTDETIEDDIRATWTLRRGNDGSFDRFRLKAAVTATFVEPTRDEVRTALAQILDEALGADPDLELAGWGDAGALDLERSELPQPLAGWHVEPDLPTGDGRIQAELEHLRRWKAEALPLLETLDDCHDLVPPDRQAPLGHSKADAVLRYLRDISG